MKTIAISTEASTDINMLDESLDLVSGGGLVTDILNAGPTLPIVGGLPGLPETTTTVTNLVQNVLGALSNISQGLPGGTNLNNLLNTIV